MFSSNIFQIKLPWANEEEENENEVWLAFPYYHTDPFIFLEFQNSSHYIPELHRFGHSPDFEALKVWRGRSGIIAQKGPF